MDRKNVVYRKISVKKLFDRNELEEITSFLARPGGINTYPYHSLVAMYDFARVKNDNWIVQQIVRYLKTLTNLAIVVHEGKRFTGRHTDDALESCTNLKRLHLVIANDGMTTATALEFARSKFPDETFPASLDTITFASCRPMSKNRLSILTRARAEADASLGWEEFGKRELRAWGRAMDPVVIKHDAAWGVRFVESRNEIDLIRPGVIDDGSDPLNPVDHNDFKPYRFMHNFPPVLVWRWVVYSYVVGGQHPPGWSKEIETFAEEDEEEET